MARPANVAPPLTMAEVASQFERLLVPPIALAVSGGSDSMALLLLAAEWTRSRGAAGEVAPLTAITVDHGLRAESAAEAEFVAAKCASLAIPHTILRWTGPKPTTGLPEAARQARYDLIAEHLAADARAHTGRPQRRLATAHHRDDVAETFLMRLARGSGLDGLAAMAESTTWPPCGGRLPGRPLMTIVRPLLSVPKDHLIATLAARGCGWHEDPTNRDSSFERARVREVLTRLAPVGLGGEVIASSAMRLARAEAAIDQATDELIADAVRVDHYGAARIGLDQLRRAAAEICGRLVSRVVQAVRGAAWPPRLARVEGVVRAICARKAGPRLSLGGTVLSLDEASRTITVVREVRASRLPAETLLPRGRFVWDDRFIVAADDGSDRIRIVRALETAEWRALRAAEPGLTGGIDERIALTLPAIFDGKTLISVPPLGWTAPGTDGTGGVTVTCCLADRLGAPCSDNRHPAPRSTA